MADEQKDVQIPNFEGEEMKMPENTDAQPVEKESSSLVNGPLLLGLTVLLIALLGGMYYWFSTLTSETGTTPAPKAERPTAADNNEPESTTAEAQAGALQTTSPSDELGAIEADLEATDLESLDAEMQAIETELEAALETETTE